MKEFSIIASKQGLAVDAGDSPTSVHLIAKSVDMSPNSVIRQICHQIHWIVKYVTKFSELANLSSNTVNHQMCHQLPNWSNIWFQGLAVMLGCRLPTPVGPPSTSHTAVDLKSYTTRLWKSWKQERHPPRVVNLSGGNWKMCGIQWECETPKRNSPESDSWTMMWPCAWH